LNRDILNSLNKYTIPWAYRFGNWESTLRL